MKKLPKTGLWIPDKEEWYLNFNKNNYDEFNRSTILQYQIENIRNAERLVGRMNRHYAVDVGANIGLISMQLCEKFEHVIAFEPHPDTFECLKRNVRPYQKVQCHNLAIGNTTRSVNFTNFISDCSHNHIAEDLNKPVIIVDQKRLDDCGLPGCDLLKIDVEGYEYEVIQGAIATIEKFHPVIILEEVNLFRKRSSDEVYKRYGKNFIARHRLARQTLEDMGYAIYCRHNHDYILAFARDFVSSELLSPSESVEDDHQGI